MLAGPRPGGKLALVPGARCRDWPRYDAGLLASVWTAWSWRADCLSPGVIAGAVGLELAGGTRDPGAEGAQLPGDGLV
jgi:hypothetical protein